MRPLTLAAAIAAAVISLAGCGAPGSSPAPAGASPSAAAAPSCRQQYETWKHATAAKAAGKKLITALKSVESASNAEDIPNLASALKKAGPAAAKLARYPMPSCADPKGYWSAVLTRVRAASDNAKSTSGLASIMLAEVPLKGLPKIERKLSAELKRTARVK